MNKHAMQQEAHQAYTEWLSKETWDVFLTMTDPGMPAPEAMYKRTRFAMNQINRQLYGRNYWKKGLGIEYVIGLERQTRGSVHSHSLIRLPNHDAKDRNQFSLGYWHKKINDLGGWARIELPRNSQDTVSYVTKYVCKEGEIYLSETLTPSAPKSYKNTLLGLVK